MNFENSIIIKGEYSLIKFKPPSITSFHDPLHQV